MTRRDDVPDPVPREWLPDSHVPPEEDAAYWEGRLQALMSSAEPTLASYRTRPAPAPSWLEALAARWRLATAGAFAVAASAVLALGVGTRHPSAPGPHSIVLATLAGEGEPAALWSGAGAAADPTLALLVLQGAKDRAESNR